jgi:hypothetical protein
MIIICEIWGSHSGGGYEVFVAMTIHIMIL